MDELRRTVPVLGLTILAFFAHQSLHIEPATVALTGAAVALLLTKKAIDEVLSGIEWPTLFFFVALFVIVGALEETGFIDKIAEGVKDFTQDSRTAELLGIVWASAIGSGIVDNIPLTATMIPVAANVAASGLTERVGRPIGFVPFLKVGVSVTLLTIVMASAYVTVRYVVL